MKTRVFTALAAAAVAASLASPAHAQVAGATVGVVFANATGGSVDCDPPDSTGIDPLQTCPVGGLASGQIATNFCRETASASAPPVSFTVARAGCTVTLDGSVTGPVSTAGQSGETAVYTCFGVGLGTVSYEPAPGSPGPPMTGIVILTYVDGVLTAEGALFNLGPVTAGQITATIIDPCGPDALAHAFAGEINL